MGQARFLFTAAWGPGASGDVPSARGTAASDPRPAAVRWRLLAGNNRQLGRGADVYPDVGAARLAAQALQERLPDSEQFLLRMSRAPRWAWNLQLDGSLVAVSGRRYESERTVLRALHLFLNGVLVATVDDGRGTRCSTSRRDLTRSYLNG